MNLLTDPWIPVRRRSGKRERIRACDLTAGIDEDPIVELASPRPDFDGALAQFLIGLVQTRFAPGDGREWRRRFDAPPSPDTLHGAWDCDVGAFNLDTGERRFGQESELEGSGAKEVGVEALLPETPGDKTRKENTDHFVKRTEGLALCRPCTATALFAIQTNSPQGGRGHRTGLRGGGPITTLLLGQDLWKTVWLNVLLAQDFERPEHGNRSREKASDRYPWLASLRTPESQEVTYPDDVHPAQVFWSLPRRLWVRFSDKNTPCRLCGEADQVVARTLLVQAHGVNYWDHYLHPLSPYRAQSDGTTTPLHGSPSGLGYRDWFGLVFENEAKGLRPAEVVRAFLLSERRKRADHRLWSFGYDMDKQKVRAWIDERFPLLLPTAVSDEAVDQKRRNAYEANLFVLVESSAFVQDQCAKRTKEAITRRPKALKGDTSFLDRRFTELTTEAFERAQRRLLEDLESEEHRESVLREWWKTLRGAARAVFQETIPPESVTAGAAGRVARAWRNLNTALRGKKLVGILGIPQHASESVTTLDEEGE